MPEELLIYLYGLLVALLLPSLTWIVSAFKDNVNIVDSLWSLLLLALGGSYFLLIEFSTPRGVLVITLLALWALRLSAYLTWRNWGKPEDARYQAIRLNHSPGFRYKSLWIVFLLQGLLAWVISAPLLPAVTSSRPLFYVDLIAALVVLFGILFESIADAQLAAFKARADSHGKVMDRGLWHYTRHPNYFGEFCVWWGFFLFAFAAGAWWSIFSPLLMTVLLLRVSGVTLLEKDIAARRPGYAEYVATTNAFVPGSVRKSATATLEHNS